MVRDCIVEARLVVVHLIIGVGSCPCRTISLIFAVAVFPHWGEYLCGSPCYVMPSCVRVCVCVEGVASDTPLISMQPRLTHKVCPLNSWQGSMRGPNYRTSMFNRKTFHAVAPFCPQCKGPLTLCVGWPNNCWSSYKVTESVNSHNHVKLVKWKVNMCVRVQRMCLAQHYGDGVRDVVITVSFSR